MEIFSTSMLLSIAIAAVIVAYSNYKKARDLHSSVQSSLKSMTQLEEELKQLKIQQKAILDIIPHISLLQAQENEFIDSNKLFSSADRLNQDELVEKTDLGIWSVALAQIYRHDERDELNLIKGKKVEKTITKKEVAMDCINLIETNLFPDINELNVTYVRSQDINESKQTKEELQQFEARFKEFANREALINRLARQIRNSLDLDTILETAVVEIRNLLQLDRCVFIWYRPDAIHPHWEIVQEAKKIEVPSFINNCVPVIGIFNFTTKICRREIIKVVDINNLSNPVEREFFNSLGYSAVLLMPIHTQSGEIGIVSCSHSSKSRFWSEREVELLSVVADQLAIAIDQAELYKQSRLATAKAQEQATKFEQTLHELQQTQAQLIQSEKMSSLGQLVAGVAHEINNPINFISGNIAYASEYSQHLLNLVQLYMKHYPNPIEEIKTEVEKIDLNFIKQDLPKIISSMKRGADRIRQIVLSLRSFSRLDEAEMKQVDIHEGIDNTLLVLTHRLNNKNPEHPGIQIIKDYGELPLVQCYAGLLNQVFMNILSNAIDAIDEYIKGHPEHLKSYAGTILISTQIFNSNQVIILIGDNGLGMTKEVCHRIFDPFFTTKPVGTATGLGMSITYKIIVEQHRGELQCISAPGKGTAFLIQIPIRQHSRNR
jgi:signal transduction histidine kinase